MPEIRNIQIKVSLGEGNSGSDADLNAMGAALQDGHPTSGFYVSDEDLDQAYLHLAAIAKFLQYRPNPAPDEYSLVSTPESTSHTIDPADPGQWTPSTRSVIYKVTKTVNNNSIAHFFGIEYQ